MSEIKKTNVLGHVVQIIDKYTLIVDVGKPRLSIDDKIQVYTLGDSILGLDGKELCKFIHVKDTLDVIDVQEKYSVCKKNKTVIRTISAPQIGPTSPMLEHKYEEHPPLLVDDSEIMPLSPSDTKVHVGDLIKLA